MIGRSRIRRMADAGSTGCFSGCWPFRSRGNELQEAPSAINEDVLTTIGQKKAVVPEVTGAGDVSDLSQGATLKGVPEDLYVAEQRADTSIGSGSMNQTRGKDSSLETESPKVNDNN